MAIIGTNPSCVHNIKQDVLLARKHTVSKVFESKSIIKKDMQCAGVYVFWWDLKSPSLLNRINEAAFIYKVKGPHVEDKGQHFIPIHFNQEWLEAATFDNHLCLYVGKSTNVSNRINGHVKWNINPLNDNKSATTIWKNSKPNSEKANKDYDRHIWRLEGQEERGEIKFGFGKKPNTVSQLRIGLERIFQKDAHEIIKKNVKISCLPYPEKGNAINRFYMEERLIGTLFPLLNIDVER